MDRKNIDSVYRTNARLENVERMLSLVSVKRDVLVDIKVWGSRCGSADHELRIHADSAKKILSDEADALKTKLAEFGVKSS